MFRLTVVKNIPNIGIKYDIIISNGLSRSAEAKVVVLGMAAGARFGWPQRVKISQV